MAFSLIHKKNAEGWVYYQNETKHPFNVPPSPFPIFLCHHLPSSKVSALGNIIRIFSHTSSPQNSRNRQPKTNNYKFHHTISRGRGATDLHLTWQEKEEKGRPSKFWELAINILLYSERVKQPEYANCWFLSTQFPTYQSESQPNLGPQSPQESSLPPHPAPPAH